MSILTFQLFHTENAKMKIKFTIDSRTFIAHKCSTITKSGGMIPPIRFFFTILILSIIIVVCTQHCHYQTIFSCVIEIV